MLVLMDFVTLVGFTDLYGSILISKIYRQSVLPKPIRTGLYGRLSGGDLFSESRGVFIEAPSMLAIHLCTSLGYYFL